MDIEWVIEQKRKNLKSSPLCSSYQSNPFDNSLSPIVHSTNARMIPTVHTVMITCSCNRKEILTLYFLVLIQNFNKIRTSTILTKQKSAVNETTSLQSTSSQVRLILNEFMVEFCQNLLHLDYSTKKIRDAQYEDLFYQIKIIVQFFIISLLVLSLTNIFISCIFLYFMF